MIAVCIFSFAAGWFIHSMRWGYHYKIHSEKAVSSENGIVTLRHTTESIGFSPLDTGYSVISVEPESGGEITLYKAKRIFQESYPHVKEVRAEGHAITWDDGENSYKLLMMPRMDAD